MGAAAAAACAAAVAVTGGIDLRLAGVPLRARSWDRPALLALLLLALGIATSRGEFIALIRRIGTEGAVERLARLAALAAVCWAALAALGFGTFAAGGADSYGYISQADMLSRGRLLDVLPRDPAFTWPGADDSLTPLGYVKDSARGLLLPQYPPGLPLLMAPLAALHARAVFLLVPTCAAAAIFLCWRLGRRLGEPLAGAFAAVLLSVSPTFLYQAVQPMSDVPVMACWMAALLLAAEDRRRNAAASGVIASIAILIRPNLAPLLILVAAAAAGAGARIDWRRAAVCLAASLPGLLALGVIQQVRFGSPLASGYGAAGGLFAVSHIGPNLARYPAWMTAAHSPFILLWVLAPLWIRGRETGVRRLAWIAYGFAWAVVLAYLPYVYLRREEWFYSRFLLPGLPVMLVFGTVLLLAGVRRILPREGAERASALLVAALVLFCLTKAQAFGVFSLHAGERKYPAVGAFVRENLPSNAAVFAMQHSGSLRYYANRLTLRWDVLDGSALDSAVAAVSQAGYEPYLVLDPHEEPMFHARFSGAAPAALDNLVPVGSIRGTRVYAFSREADRRERGSR